MTDGVTGLGRIDRIIWSLIGAVAVLVLAAAALDGFTVAWRSFWGPGSAVLLLVAVQHVYRKHRPDPRLASALGSTAQVAAFSAVGAPLSYLAATFNLPLHDHWFEAADRAFGFDWFALLAWLKAHGTAAYLLRLIYSSLMPQILLVVLTLSLSGRIAELRRFVLAFMITTLVTIAVSALWPAEGVWLAHKLGAAEGLVPPSSGGSWPIFLGLRDGSIRTLMATGAEGIITFPSLHAALGLILAAALWPMPVMRWFGVVINGLMMVSIPVEGSHYFVDMIAGLAIAAAALAIARALVTRHAVPLATAKDLGAKTAPQTAPETAPVALH